MNNTNNGNRGARGVVHPTSLRCLRHVISALLVLMLISGPALAYEYHAVFTGKGTVNLEDAIDLLPNQAILAEIYSQADNDAALAAVLSELTTTMQNIPQDTTQLSFWIGGVDNLEEGTWYWMSSGNSFALYNNWAGGEPNNVSSGTNYILHGDEDAATMYSSTKLLTQPGGFWGEAGQWNDTPATYRHDGYIYQIVPEPSTLALSAFGFCAVSLLGWRRRRR